MRARSRSFSAARLTLRLGLGLALLSLSLVLPPKHKHAEASTTPNIVFILTDDQRWDTLWSMPNVQSQLVAHGINFTNSFVVNSLCCPSRASILTGQYSHSTLVYDNSGHYGGFGSFHEDSNTAATWLQSAGYRTGLLGKYLNGYNSLYVPPGWSEWSAFKGAPDGGAYYNYVLNTNGTAVSYGNTEADYSTDVLANKADFFIRTTPGAQPLFLYFSTKAPHTPSTPAPKYKNKFNGLQPLRPPNYNEADVSDKPAWVRALPLMPTAKQNQIDTSRKNQYRTLLSVDDAVSKIVTALTDTGRLSNTLIVLMGDNGWSLGEHRWNNKKVAYEESIRVPLVVRYDPLVTGPRTDGHLMTNIDLAPTFADLAGVTATGSEGLDMMPLIANPNAPWRNDFLIEHLENSSGRDFPSFCAVRDDSLQPEGYTYVDYGTGEEELYDLKTDFYELQNLAGDPGHATQKAALRTIAQTLCSPPPPGFTFSYDALPPSIPGSLTATPESSTEIDLSWAPSIDNVAVTGYTIYRDGAPLATVGPTPTTYADTTGSPGTTYSYTVDAFDAAGNHSAQSAPAVATTFGDTEPPSQPKNLVATAPSPVEVDLTWSPSIDNFGVTGYTVYRDGSFLDTVGGNTTAYADRAVHPNTTYIYTVDAFDGAGNHSILSDPASVTTRADTSPPSVPTALSATVVSDTRIDLSWTGSTDDVGVTGYTIYRNGPSVTTVGALVTTYSDTGLTPSTLYTYTVDAFDGAGNHSAQSAPASGSTLADTSPPSKPTGLTASAPLPTEVDLSWIPSTDDVGVTVYRIRRNGSFLTTVNGSQNSYVDTRVLPGTMYKYTVTAGDGAGNISPQSDPVTVTTPPLAPGLPRYQ